MWAAIVTTLMIGQAEPLPAGVRRVYAPRDAAQAAWLDLSQNVPVYEHPFAFYVFDNLKTKESRAVIIFTVNAVLSQASTIILPRVVADGSVLYFPLSQSAYAQTPRGSLAPQRKDFERLWNALQKLADREPYFHEPSAHGQEKWIKITVPRYYATDGQWYDYTWKKVKTAFATEPALGSGGAGPLRLLAEASNNQLPIVRGDWLVATAWGSVDIEGIRGSYYDLAGIQKSNERGKTDFDLFLESVGADQKLVAKIRTDQRTVMLSELQRKKKWRMIEAFFSAGVRPNDGPSLVTITHDVKDQEHDAKKHAFLNLLNFEDDAREVIAAKRNGLHLFALFNGKGERQDEAPFDVVTWRESPHATTRLTVGISCIACHGPDGGYKPTRNYVVEAAAKGFVPASDLTGSGDPVDDWDRLQGLYNGELNGPLKLAATGYALAVDRCTGSVFGPKSVQGCSAATAKTYADYFEVVTPQRACRELGYEVSEKETEAALKQIVPPAKDEDGRIGTLRTGTPITVSDWQEVFFELSLRDVLRPGTQAFDRPQEKTKPAAHPAPEQQDAPPGRRPTGGAAGAGGRLVPKDSQPQDNQKKKDVRPLPAFGGSQRPGGDGASDRSDRGPRVAVDQRLAEGLINGLDDRSGRGDNDSQRRVDDRVGVDDPAGAADVRSSSPNQRPDGNALSLLGLHLYAPPGSQCWLYGNYVGVIGRSGYVFYPTDNIPAGEVWKDYRVTVRYNDGTVRKTIVDLVKDKSVEVRL